MISVPMAPRWEEIDSFIEAYERSHGSGVVGDIGAYLPDPTHPHYLSVLRELVRADLEYRWESGQPRRVEDYVLAYPVLGQDHQTLEAITFEEYRLRLQAGERPALTEYEERFGLEWLDWPLALAESSDRGHGSTPTTPLPYLKEAPLATGSGVGRDAHELPAPGAEFLGFQVTEEIGRGTFARVYLAYQGDLADRPVVLKVSSDAVRESRSLARLQHANIVPVYSVHRAGHLSAICMPYFGRTTLADVLRELHGLPGPPASGAWLRQFLERRRDASNGWPVPAPANDLARRLTGRDHVAVVLDLVARLADGLWHAHEGNILHQDLKPANVLLADDGEPMLLDFNLARETTQKAGGPDVIGGTVPYMAPEQLEALRDGRPHADPRSDLYSLGLILFELLAGRPPVEVPAGTLPEKCGALIAARRQPPPDVRRHNPAVTPAVAAIVRRSLEPDPARRYQSARQLREDLDRHLADLPLRWAAEPSWGERARKWARRHPRLTSGYAVGAAAALVLLVGGGFYALRVDQFARAEQRRAEVEARTRATSAHGRFAENVKEVSFLLGSPSPTAEDLAEGARIAREALDRYRVVDDPTGFAGHPNVVHLSVEERGRMEIAVREMLLLAGRGQRLLSLRADGLEREEFLRQAVRANELAETCAAAAAEGMRSVTLQRAALKHAAGQEEAARALVATAARLPLTTSRDHYLAALEQIARGDFRTAVGLLRKAKRLDPKDSFVHYLLGACHAELKEPHLAAASLEASLALRPEAAAGHYLRARVHHELGEHDKAVAEFDEAIRLRPSDLNPYIDRALAKLSRKELKGAEEDLTYALKEGTLATRVYFIRARVRQLRGDAAGAASDHAEGLKREPRDEVSWVARGVARMAADPNGALADFDRALRINDRYAPALEDKASVLAERLGRTEEAIAALDAVVRIAPEHGPSLASRGVLLARLGRRDAALRDAREAERLDPRPEVLYQAAGIWALTSRKVDADRAEALRLLQAALRKDYGFDLLAIDPDLKPLHALPEYHKLVEAARTLRTRLPRNDS